MIKDNLFLNEFLINMTFIFVYLIFNKEFTLCQQFVKGTFKINLHGPRIIIINIIWKDKEREIRVSYFTEKFNLKKMINYFKLYIYICISTTLNLCLNLCFFIYYYTLNRSHIRNLHFLFIVLYLNFNVNFIN